MSRRDSMPSRRGFTLIEMLTVIGILGLLAALLLPAIMASREAARKMTCGNNLHQFAIAIANYESGYKCFPPAGLGDELSHIECLLPYFERQMDVLLCPTDPGAKGELRISYCGNAGTGVQRHGFDGMFRYATGFEPYDSGGVIRASDVTDGLSQTAAVAEAIIGGSAKRLTGIWHVPEQTAPDQLDAFAASCAALPDDPAAAGILGNTGSWGFNFRDFNVGQTLYNHVLPPDSPRCINGQQYQLSCFPAGSYHAGGITLLYADGHATFTSDAIDRNVWRKIGSRAGGE